MKIPERFPIAFHEVSKRAVECGDCFVAGTLQRPWVDRAQPRWIGPHYEASSPRIVWMMLNPGSGAGRHDDADTRLRNLLNSYANGEGNLDAIMEHQHTDIPNWGGGRLVKFLELAGLDLDHVALMNVAWCASRGNQYPSWMLRHCFARHTAQALSSLRPQIVVLSGSACHAFSTAIRDDLPGTLVLKTLHYAHRQGTAATVAAAKDIRDAMASL